MADSPFEVVALSLKQIIDTEFAPEGITAIFDNIHEALGQTRVTVGIAPVEDVPRAGNAVVQETWVEVRFFDLWKREIDPGTVINPTRITAFAERFRRAVRSSQATDPGTGQVWYFDVTRIQYPNDPTGNKSRFVATIRAFGNNSALVETTG
jgi:hypothetical protein